MASKWLSCSKFTVLVELDDDYVIIKGAPIIGKFVGQPYSDLRTWVNNFPPVMEEWLY